MENFKEEYARIREINNSHLVAEELHLKSYEFRDAYRALSRKERNARYRAHAKDKINESRREKYKIKKEVKEEKPITHIITPLKVDDIDTSVKREYADNKKLKDLTQSSIKAYGDTIKALYNKYHSKPLAEDSEILKYLRWEKHNPTKLFKQNEYIILNIKDIAENYASKLSLLYSLFSRFNTKKLKLIREAIYPYSTAYIKNYQEYRNDLVVNVEEVSKISFVKEDVLANADKIENLEMKVLYMLMFMMPTRRLGDYRITYIAGNGEDIKDERFNWYYNNKIYINDTKNKQKIVLDIPDEITKIINEIIIPARKASNDFMFLIGNYSQPYLSELFTKLMVKIYGTPFTATNIRKIYATQNIQNTGIVMLENQSKMGHNLREHLNYVIPNTSLS